MSLGTKELVDGHLGNSMTGLVLLMVEQCNLSQKLRKILSPFISQML